MSDNKNKKSPSAQDLLTRLKKKPEDKPAAEKKSSTYKDFLEKRNKNKEADTIGAVTADVKDAGSVYDEVYAAPEEHDAPEVSLDAAAAAFFDESVPSSPAFDEVQSFGEFLDPDALVYPEITEELAFADEIPEAFEASLIDNAEAPEVNVPEVVSFEELFPETEADLSEYLPEIENEEQLAEAVFRESIAIPEIADGADLYEDPSINGEMAVPEIAEGAELYEQAGFEDMVDEYGEYLSDDEAPFVGTSPEELAAYADAAGVSMAEEFAEPDEVSSYVGTYSEMPVIPICYRTGIIFSNEKIENVKNSSYSDIYFSIESYSIKN